MSVFSTSISALKSVRTALETTSHNISNASNPHYSRQEVELATRGAQQLGPHMIGTGVIVQSVERQVDDFMNTSYRQALSQGARADFYYDAATLVDSYIGDLDTGVSRSIEEYYNALQGVSVNPSYESKGILLARSEALAGRIKDYDDFMRNRYLDIKSQQSQMISTINQLSQSIATINREIADVYNSSSTTKPNDLLDQRDSYVQELSTYINLNIVEDSNRQLNISCGNGINLVVGSQNEQLALRNNTYEGHKNDILLKGAFNDLDVTANITGGQLGASLLVRDELLDLVDNRMGRLLTTLTLATNQVYEKGMDELGQVGKKFFFDVNDADQLTRRTTAHANNDGNAIFSVGFSPLFLEEYAQSSVVGDPSALISVDELPQAADLSAMTISNYPIPTPVPSDDQSSFVGQQASAISASQAINKVTVNTGVKATALENVVYLGQFQSDGNSSPNIEIAGQNFDLSLYSTVWQVAQAMNQSLDGIEASVQPDQSLVVRAEDGRNIDFKTFFNGDSNSKSYFSALSTNTEQHLVSRSALKLESVDSFTLSENFQELGFPQGIYPNQYESLEASTYTLSFDGGSYTLIRNSDNTRVYKGAESHIQVDGLEIDLSFGQPKTGDIFFIKPYKDSSVNFSVVPKSAKELALALPLKTLAHNSNRGDGTIDISLVSQNIEPLSGYQYQQALSSGAIHPPLKVEFLSESSYLLKDGATGNPIGPVQSYEGQKDIILPMAAVANDKSSSDYRNQTFRPGYQIHLSGQMQAGDTFNVVFNTQGDLDTRTALAMASIQTKNLIDDGTATCEQEYTQISANIGTITAQMKASSTSYDKLIETIQEKRFSASGVNLDEEAANIMMLQQAYQAAAQMISIQRTLFDTMLSMMR